MQVDNEIYESAGGAWWSEAAGFEFTSLRYCLQPVRMEYFRSVLRERGLTGGRVLDVGCGGGYLAEDFAREGFSVSGVDPAARTIAAAREHAAQSALSIDYRVASGEALPFGDAAFHIVCCCDVLEHVDDLPGVVREAARVLKPGGLLLFDTINRTLRSKLVLIKAWQDWNLGGFGRRDVHVWERFITPAELAAVLGEHGMQVGALRGIGPTRNPLALLFGLLRVRAGRLRGAAVAGTFSMRESDDLSLSYMGWATKRPPDA